MSYADFIRDALGSARDRACCFWRLAKTFLQFGNIILCGKVVALAPIVSKLTFRTVAHGVAGTCRHDAARRQQRCGRKGRMEINAEISFMRSRNAQRASTAV